MTETTFLWMLGGVGGVFAFLFGIIFKHLADCSARYALITEKIGKASNEALDALSRVQQRLALSSASSVTEATRVRIELNEYKLSARDQFASVKSLDQMEQRITKYLADLSDKMDRLTPREHTQRN